MIETSERYNTLFDSGAIQDYRIVINGIEYTNEHIYDTIELDQDLFDKPTFTVGSFAISSLKTRLILNTKDIMPNASVKFLYRYNGGMQWVNKIKDDFSDFTAYRGATVTKNKTFPIEVFKGGRNLLLDSKNSYQIRSSVSSVYPMEYDTLPDGTRRVRRIFDGFPSLAFATYTNKLLNLDAGKYTLSMEIRPTEKTIFGGMGGSGIKRDCKVGEWTRIDLTYNIAQGGDLQMYGIYFTIVDDQYKEQWIEYRNFKLEKGDIATDWSPAPEDGYGYTGSDGAYHIQTSGGTNIIKYFKNVGIVPLDNKRSVKVSVHPFLDMAIGNGMVSRNIDTNILSNYNSVFKGNGLTQLGIHFITPNTSNSLDFIASDPSIEAEEEYVSEWIQKFSGNIVDRKQFNDSVIEITAMDKGYNYDVFLDNIVVDEYPANARDVAIKCATHLGVELVNPSDIINQNIVDYPNELTIVEVLKNIAKSSGGNFTMLGDGRLKIIILKNNIEVLEKYDVQSITNAMDINPITMVTAYWDDESAFQVGTTDGSDIVIDNPWATQLSTEYVHSVLNGFK